MKNKIENKIINGDVWIKRIDVQELIDSTNSISGKLQKEIVLIENIRDQADTELHDFAVWLCAFIGVPVPDFILDLWKKAKVKIEIRKAGGVH